MRSPEGLDSKVEGSILDALAPVSPISSQNRVGTLLLLMSAAVTSVAILRIGSAGWHALNGLEATILFTIFGIGMVALAYNLASRMMPGSRIRVHPVVLIAAPLFCMFIAVIILFPYRVDPEFVSKGVLCWEIGFVAALASLILVTLALRRGYPSQPVWTGACVGALSALNGLVVLQIFCPNLERLHVAVWHLGSAVSAIAVGTLIGGLQRRRRQG